MMEYLKNLIKIISENRVTIVVSMLTIFLLFFKDYFLANDRLSGTEKRIQDGWFILSIAIPVIILLTIRSYFKKK